MKRLVIILLTSLFLKVSFAHELHFSVTNIDVTKDSIHLAVQISAADYFQMQAIAKHNNSGHHHGHHHHHEIKPETKDFSANDVEKAIQYILKQITVQIDSNAVKFNFENYLIKNDMVWFYFEASQVQNIGTTTISNTLFINEFYNQNNLVTVKFNGIEKGLEFDRTTTTRTIELK